MAVSGRRRRPYTLFYGRVKMKNFINVIKEIDRTLNMVFVFSSILNAAIFFLSVYLLLSIVNLYPILVLIPAAIYFALRLYSR